jgi:hypothetical protein
MKMLTVYLEHALEFERLASSEQSEAFKAELLKQATAYRMLAEKRGGAIRRSEAKSFRSPASPVSWHGVFLLSGEKPLPGGL